MWFNSIVREKPYQFRQGVAWLSSVRVVRCALEKKRRNGRNPYLHLLIYIYKRTMQAFFAKIFFRLILIIKVLKYFNILLLILNKKIFKKRKRLRSSRHGPYKLGYTRVTMIVPKRGKNVSWSRSQKSNLSSNCRLKLACMKSESLVIVDQHATVNILGPCTHRPSRQGSEIGLKY